MNEAKEKVKVEIPVPSYSEIGMEAFKKQMREYGEFGEYAGKMREAYKSANEEVFGLFEIVNFEDVVQLKDALTGEDKNRRASTSMPPSRVALNRRR